MLSISKLAEMTFHRLATQCLAREQKWLQMVMDWTRTVERSANKLKSRVRKGIPDSIRGLVWPLLCGARDQADKFPDLYEQLSMQREKQQLSPSFTSH